MIIVSQDKDTIVNFDNVEILGIGNLLEDDDGKFKMLANTISDSQYILGKYDTEERAKKVLKEIIGKYKATEALKIAINRIADDVGALGLENAFIYEMPKE